jgi:hypothetical protein
VHIVIRSTMYVSNICMFTSIGTANKLLLGLQRTYFAKCTHLHMTTVTNKQTNSVALSPRANYTY